MTVNICLVFSLEKGTWFTQCFSVLTECFCFLLPDTGILWDKYLLPDLLTLSESHLLFQRLAWFRLFQNALTGIQQIQDFTVSALVSHAETAVGRVHKHNADLPQWPSPKSDSINALVDKINFKRQKKEKKSFGYWQWKLTDGAMGLPWKVITFKVEKKRNKWLNNTDLILVFSYEQQWTPAAALLGLPCMLCFIYSRFKNILEDFQKNSSSYSFRLFISLIPE